MKASLFYEVIIRDCYGKVVHRERRKSKSFVQQWNQMVYSHLRYATITMIDTSGAPIVTHSHSVTFSMNAAAGNILMGIVFGTGNTPVAIDDFALDTLITEGAGAGQLNYLVCSLTAPSVSVPHCGYVVSRSAVNNSGGLITVCESGIYFRGSPSYHLGVRDVFGAPQGIPNGGSITVNYTLRVTA